MARASRVVDVRASVMQNPPMRSVRDATARMAPRARLAALLAASALLLAAAAGAADIRVMTSGAFTAPYLELAPQFEQTHGGTVMTLTTTMGVGADSIPSRLERGEAVDVVIVAAASLDALIRDGRVLDDSRTDLARSSIGMAVRAGAPRPDIGSLEAFTRTLRQAKSVAYSASVSGDYLVKELFPQLGIAEEMRPKSRQVVGERVGAVVARGEAEIGFQQMSELLPIAGIDVVGPLPPGAQRVTVFSAGVASGAREPEAARAFIRFLASADAHEAIRRAGLEPIAAR